MSTFRIKKLIELQYIVYIFLTVRSPIILHYEYLMFELHIDSKVLFTMRNMTKIRKKYCQFREVTLFASQEKKYIFEIFQTKSGIRKSPGGVNIFLKSLNFPFEFITKIIISIIFRPLCYVRIDLENTLYVLVIFKKKLDYCVLHRIRI